MSTKILTTTTRAGLGALVLLAAGWLLSADTALAQESRSLQIRDGQVYIDGRHIPENELPESLEVDGVQVQYSFSGDIEPVIRLDGGFFVLEEGRLRPAEPHERNDVSVIFRGEEPHAIQLSTMDTQLAEDAARSFSTAASEQVVVLQRKAAELQAQAEHFKQLQLHSERAVSDERMDEIERAAQELTVRAEEAARMAEAMPRLHVQRYFDRIQRNDHVLFERLIDERQMEGETIRLATEIRRLEGDAREQKVAELRQNLDEIFNLKQENRREEINQLEERLEDLQERLVERERMRDEIIERRLRELLGQSESMNW